MSIKIVTDTDGFLSIQEDWERLQELDDELTYYSTFQYNYAWWLTFGEDRNNKLFIICCSRDNEMVGIAPLVIRTVDKKIVKCHVLGFMGKGDYFNFILHSQKGSPAAIIKEIFKAIEDHSDLWDKIELTHLATDTSLLHFLLRHDRYNPSIKYLTSCPSIRIGGWDTAAGWDTSGINAKAKKKLRKLQQETDYQFKMVDCRQSGNIYDRISNVHKQEKTYLHEQRGRIDRRSLFEDQKNEEFYKRVFMNNDQVIASFLELEDSNVMIAYQLFFLHRGKLYGWNTGYSPDYAKYGVFDVLMLETIRRLIEQGQVTDIDLGAGSYPWKFRWTNQFTVMYSLQLWNNDRLHTRLYRMLVKGKGILKYLNRKTAVHS